MTRRADLKPTHALRSSRGRKTREPLNSNRYGFVMFFPRLRCRKSRRNSKINTRGGGRRSSRLYFRGSLLFFWCFSPSDFDRSLPAPSVSVRSDYSSAQTYVYLFDNSTIHIFTARSAISARPSAGRYVFLRVAEQMILKTTRRYYNCTCKATGYFYQ